MGIIHEQAALAIVADDRSHTTSRRCGIRLFSAAILLSIGTAPKVVDVPAEASPARIETVSFNGSDSIAADEVANYIGGIAARIRTADGSPMPGDILMLMATAGSNAPARLYDHTPYTHDSGDHSDTLESNTAAMKLVETITGQDLDLLALTTPPGGGRSAGLVYAMTYLDVISHGDFTGNLRVAATGKLEPFGYIHPINAIDEKTAAAHLARADVLFTPSTPSNHHTDAYGARSVGELFRARNTGATLDEERRLDNYRDWGADRPNGMDIVGVRHIADVAAYLCGTGSNYACSIFDILADDIIESATNTSGDQITPRSKPSEEYSCGSSGSLQRCVAQ